MMSFQLNLSSVAEQNLHAQLERSRKQGNLNEVNRISAILSFGSGYFLNEVSDILQVAISTLYQWIKKYLTGGISSLLDKKRPGRPAKLTKKQRKKLARDIQQGPEACGFDSCCWRTPMIQELVLQKFGVFYSVNYLSQLLKGMGFSYQKAKFVAANQDQEQRDTWLQSTWKKILKKAKKLKAYILFGDEASFPQWGTLNYTWATKGKQPIIKTSGSRKSYKVFGAIDYFTGKFFAKGHLGKLNAESYIEYLTEILSNTRKHIFLIQDGAPYHKSKLVKKFFESKKGRLTVHTLPSYSPDYNPIEMLWKKIKTAGTHLRYFPTFDSLVEKVEEMLIEFSCAPSAVLSLFGLYN